MTTSPSEGRGLTKAYDTRELARRVVERGNHMRAVPGTRGQLQRLSANELLYLRWLHAKVLAERGAA
jgi:hypothetical protein